MIYLTSQQSELIRTLFSMGSLFKKYTNGHTKMRVQVTSTYI